MKFLREVKSRKKWNKIKSSSKKKRKRRSTLTQPTVIKFVPSKQFKQLKTQTFEFKREPSSPGARMTHTVRRKIICKFPCRSIFPPRKFWEIAIFSILAYAQDYAEYAKIGPEFFELQNGFKKWKTLVFWPILVNFCIFWCTDPPNHHLISWTRLYIDSKMSARH